jgi:hypothetical protein
MVAALIGPHRTCARVKGALDSLGSSQEGQRQRGASRVPEVEREDEGDQPAGSSVEDGEALDGRAEDDGFESLARVPARRKANRAKKVRGISVHGVAEPAACDCRCVAWAARLPFHLWVSTMLVVSR